MSKNKIIAIIPARSGSIGIKNKNIKYLYGKPLIAWSIEAAINSRLIDQVIVTTDSKKIKEVALKYGAEVPFLRPKNISGNSTKDYPVIKHCLNFLKNKNIPVDAFIYLRPTQPLRTSKEIDSVIRIFKKKSNIDGIRTTVPTSYPPFWMKVLTKKQMLLPINNSIQKYANIPRQKLPQTVVCDGHVDIFKVNNYLTKKIDKLKCLSFFQKKRVYFDLDTIDDWRQCEEFMKKNKFSNKI